MFFVTWLQWYVGIPASFLLLFGLYKMSRKIITDEKVINISKWTVLLLFTIMLAWVLVSGIGGAFSQKNDLHWRNAIFHDLINYSWPVRYLDSMDSSIAYYFAFWLVPALVGELGIVLFGAHVGWIAANVACAVYCMALLSVVMLLLISHLKATSLKRMLLVATILIVFSGLDIFPFILDQIGDPKIIVGSHIEWWNYLQYSSNSTQLSWVFNQAVPAWLVVSLLIHEKNLTHFAFLGGMLLPYGPIPFIGLFFLMVLQASRELINAFRKHRGPVVLKNIFSTPNLIAAAVIFPVYFLFYSSNSATSSGGFGLNTLSLGYFVFISVEFVIYLILIWRDSYKKPYFIFSVVGLLLVPFVTLGNEQDFCMRASIPMLFLLMVYVLDYLLNNIDGRKKKGLPIKAKALPLVFCLMIGAVTPFVEYRATFNQTIISVENGTSMYADKFGTLSNEGMNKDNFVTINSSDTFFYKYIAKGGR